MRITWKSLYRQFSFYFARLWPCKTLPGYIVRKSPINTMSSLMGGEGGGTRDNRLRFNKIATLYFDGFWRKYKIFCLHLKLDPPPSIGSLLPNIAVASKYNFPLFSKYNLFQLEILTVYQNTIDECFGRVLWCISGFGRGSNATQPSSVVIHNNNHLPAISTLYDGLLEPKILKVYLREDINKWWKHTS